MVKLERRDATVVAAKLATPTRFLDEYSLDSLAPSHYTLGSTLEASVGAA